MRDEPILEIVGRAGRLFVRPATTTFDRIFRPAMGVTWDAESGALASPERVEWPLSRWFEQILAAAVSEYGVVLKPGPMTSWSGITDDQQRAMTSFAESDWIANLHEQQAKEDARSWAELLLRQALSQAEPHWKAGRWREYVESLTPVRDQLSAAQAKRLLIAQRRAASQGPTSA